MCVRVLRRKKSCYLGYFRRYHAFSSLFIENLTNCRASSNILFSTQTSTIKTSAPPKAPTTHVGWDAAPISSIRLKAAGVTQRSVVWVRLEAMHLFLVFLLLVVSNGLHPSSDGLHPSSVLVNSNGLHPYNSKLPRTEGFRFPMALWLNHVKSPGKSLCSWTANPMTYRWIFECPIGCP